LKNVATFEIILLIVMSMTLSLAQTVDGGQALIPVKLSLNGLKWLGGNSTVTVTVSAEVANRSKSVDLEVEPGQLINASFEFEASIPSGFSVEVRHNTSPILKVGGVIGVSDVKVSSVFFNEAELETTDKPLLVFEIVGRSYTIIFKLPFKADGLEVHGSVDGEPVNVLVEEASDGVQLSLRDILFTGSNSTSTFEIRLVRNGTSILTVEGSVNYDGLTSASIRDETGAIGELEASTIITIGPKKCEIPTSILKGFKMEGVGMVVKTTRLTISSETALYGKIPVKLLAFSSGSWFEKPHLIENATFEISTPFGLTLIVGNNSTVNLMEGWNVTITAKAEGFIPQTRSIEVSKAEEVAFYLKPVNPGIVAQVQEFILNVVRSQYLIPALLAAIIVLLIALILRR
jgi:hypothetical protein